MWLGGGFGIPPDVCISGVGISRPAPQSRGYISSKTFLDTELRSYENMRVQLKVGPTLAAQHLEALRLRRRRSGFCIYFSMIAIYNVCSFSMYKGVASRWVWEVLPATERFLNECCADQVLRAMPYLAKENNAKDHDRFAPWNCVSSLGLVALLARWSGAGGRGGGLANPGSRSAAGTLLQSVCDSVLRGTTVELTMLMDDDFQWRWPRPPAGGDAIKLVVKDSSQDGGPTTLAFRYRGCGRSCRAIAWPGPQRMCVCVGGGSMSPDHTSP